MACRALWIISDQDYAVCIKPRLHLTQHDIVLTTMMIREGWWIAENFLYGKSPSVSEDLDRPYKHSWTAPKRTIQSGLSS